MFEQTKREIGKHHKVPADFVVLNYKNNRLWTAAIFSSNAFLGQITIHLS